MNRDPGRNELESEPSMNPQTRRRAQSRHEKGQLALVWDLVPIGKIHNDCPEKTPLSWSPSLTEVRFL